MHHTRASLPMYPASFLSNPEGSRQLSLPDSCWLPVHPQADADCCLVAAYPPLIRPAVAPDDISSHQRDVHTLAMGNLSKLGQLPAPASQPHVPSTLNANRCCCASSAVAMPKCAIWRQPTPAGTIPLTVSTALMAAASRYHMAAHLSLFTSHPAICMQLCPPLQPC